MNRFFLVAVAASLAVAGCAEGPEDTLRETATNLDGIDSGVLSLELTAGTDDGDESGFSIEGPFALPEEDMLPVTELEYTTFGDEGPVTQGFLSTEETAYVVIEDQAYELSPEQVEGIRGSGEEVDDIFGSTDFGAWLESAEVGPGPTIQGAETERVEGKLDVVAALGDIFEIARRFGAEESSFPTIEDADEEHLRSAVERARLELLTGAEDRLLRELNVDIRFAVTDQELSEILGSVVGVSFRLHLEISDHNEAVEIDPPTDPLPVDELVVDDV